MSLVKGDNVLLTLYNGGFDKPYACSLNSTLEATTDYIETSISGAGNFATWEATRDSWSVSCDGLVSLEEVNKLDLAELQALQFAHTKMLMKRTHTSDTGQVYVQIGYVIITNSTDTGNHDGMNTFSLTMKGTGILTQNFVPSPISPPGMSHRLEYTATGGETSLVSSLLEGKEILEFNKDGSGFSKIITTGTPASKEAKYYICLHPHPPPQQHYQHNTE